MKILKLPQKFIIIFLIFLLILCSLMMLRFELKAASLQSQWEKHQQSLKKNKDILEQLDMFSRYVKKNAIKIDDQNIHLVSGNTWLRISNDDVSIETGGAITIGNDTETYLGYDSQKKMTFLNYNGAHVAAGNINVGGKKYNGILVRSANSNSQLVMTDKGLSISTTGKEGEYRFELKPGTGIYKITNGKSEFVLEKNNVKLKVEEEMEIGPSSDKSFGYDTTEDLMYIMNKDSRLVIGPLFDKSGKLLSNGVMLLGKTGGPQLSLTDKVITLGVPGKEDIVMQLNLDRKMIGLKQGQSKIKLEKNKLQIEVEGDINIKSKNGNVNINGKKINLNE